ncbi:hypothetical protein [Arthrobacter sp. U41]|uniref:hypothetical protein n=1 Tax=Arthrobacter sp. U41 TaxID=1849032 RepID=UPI0008596BF6|nr:hypothetical protein [Arthrobacter sp. U41]AOT02344.1 hypothetical protein ASPU41_02260 [Arthrobacter sp. U41]
METLHVELQDIGGTAWWARILTTLASQSGSVQFRFVGRVADEVRYSSSTFASPTPISPTPPEEQWAPGMTRSLEELVSDIRHDGWTQTGSGSEPWSLTFER